MARRKVIASLSVAADQVVAGAESYSNEEETRGPLPRSYLKQQVQSSQGRRRCTQHAYARDTDESVWIHPNNALQLVGYALRFAWLCPGRSSGTLRSSRECPQQSLAPIEFDKMHNACHSRGRKTSEKASRQDASSPDRHQSPFPVGNICQMRSLLHKFAMAEMLPLASGL
jgi:hypothetical protein